MPLHLWGNVIVLTFSEIQVLLIGLVVAAAAAPTDYVISYQAENHQHMQTGNAGQAVTGFYS